MAKTSTRDRLDNEINAGSMADIAFLLLIFFLVTTTIMQDKGILVRLPPWSDEPPPELQFKQRNVYSILVNAQNQLLVRGEPMDVKTLKKNCKEFIMNPQSQSNLAEAPNKAVISLKNDRGTNYETYLAVYNEIQAAYHELRDELSLQVYGDEFDDLNRTQRDDIRDQIPLKLSEAEPTSFGDEN